MGYYEESFTFSASEADIHRRIKLSAALRHMQDAASRHLDALGYTYDVLSKAGQVFLLSRAEVVFSRSPLPDQRVLAQTRPHPPKGVFFLRETNLALDGEVAVWGKSAWILADFKTHQVLRPAALGWDYPFDPVEFDGSIARYRMRDPENLSDLGQRTIRFSDLDANQHMNNAKYGDMVADFIPAQWMLAHPMRRAVLLYEHEAKLGDVLFIRGCQREPDCWYLAGYRDEARCFAAEIYF